jgi:hypothetical protein
VGDPAPRRWLILIAVFLALGLGAIVFGLITVFADGDRRAGAEGVMTLPPSTEEDPERAGPGGGLWKGEGSPIARVRSGSRVTLHARPGGRAIARLGDSTEFGSRRALAVVSRRGGWIEVLSEEIAHDRTGWVRIDPERLRFRTTPWSIHASLAEREVELRQNGEVMHRFEVTVGAEGTETPSGRFAVTDVIVGGLNPVYGCCAIALTARQENLPEGWIGGDRVALHGTSGSVGQAASSGCLRASDADARSLAELVPPGTPFFVD